MLVWPHRTAVRYQGALLADFSRVCALPAVKAAAAAVASRKVRLVSTFALVIRTCLEDVFQCKLKLARVSGRRSWHFREPEGDQVRSGCDRHKLMAVDPERHWRGM